MNLMNDVEIANEIQDATLQINPPANPIIPPQPYSDKKKNKSYLIFGLFFFFICIGVMMIYILGGVNFIMSLPFMPKTTEYVLQTSITAHEKITRFSIDVSNAKSEVELDNGKYDARTKGQFDYTNPAKPMASVRDTGSDSSDIEIRIKNNSLYERDNALAVNFAAPDLIKQKIVHKWFSLDINQTTFDSIQNYNKTVTLQIEKNIFEALNDPEVAKSLTMSSSILNGKPVYHIRFVPTPHAFDIFWSKNAGLNNSPAGVDLEGRETPHFSDYIDKYILDLWIDKDTYLVNKVTTSFTSFIKGDTTPIKDYGQQPFAFVMNVSDYEKVFDVEIPKDAVNQSDFLTKLYLKLQEDQTASQSSNLNTPEKNNEKRRVQVIAIENNIFFYAKDKGRLPPEITQTDQLISSNGANICPYIISDAYGLPMDPKLGDGSKITKCPATYDTGYLIRRDSQGRVTVSAPYAEKSEKILVVR